MALRYCFEQNYIARTLAKSKPHDLAMIDTEGCEESVRNAVKRGVFVYGYLNAGALEKERPYYPLFKHLRLAPYDGWDGEYWIDMTDRGWQQHLISEAKRMKKLGVIGLYLDNTDIYYMVTEGFRSPMRKAPSPQAVYTALSNIVLKLSDLGMIVMPNGGDVFVRKFVRAHPNTIKTVNQEGVLYQDKKRQSKEDTEYFTEYLDWKKKKGIYIRGIEYPKNKVQALNAKAYYKKHGWQGIYISYHKDLRGD